MDWNECIGNGMEWSLGVFDMKRHVWFSCFLFVLVIDTPPHLLCLIARMVGSFMQKYFLFDGTVVVVVFQGGDDMGLWIMFIELMENT